MTEAEIRSILTAVKAYASEYGALPPVGNPGTFSVLCGANEKKIVFFEGGNRFTDYGEYLDRWGKPLHLGVSESGEFHVYSSGRNKIDENGAEGSDDIVSWRKTSRLLSWSRILPFDHDQH